MGKPAPAMGGPPEPKAQFVNDNSSLSNPLPAIAASALQKSEDPGTRIGSWVPEIRQVRKVPRMGEDSDIDPVSASLSLPVLQVKSDVTSVEGMVADATRGSPEPRASTPVQLESDLGDHGPTYRVSPAKVISSQSKYRIDETLINLVEEPIYTGGSSDIVIANIIDDENFAGQAFANELQLRSKFNHENIIKLVGFVENRSSKIAWLVSPWMTNGNVREFLRSRHYEIPERVSLRALINRHQLNILVNSENRALITDFAWARPIGMTPPRSTDHRMLASAEDEILKLGQNLLPGKSLNIEDSPQSSGATFPGTATETEITLPRPALSLRWAAPELLFGNIPNLASDIWAVGWLCWEIITANSPFPLDQLPTIIVRIMKGDLPRLDDESQFSSTPSLRRLMENCWRNDARERPTATACKDKISWMPRIIPLDKEAQPRDLAQSPKLLRAVGDTYVSGLQISEGLKHITSALRIARTSSGSVETGLALLSLGRIHCIRCEYTEAEKAYKEAKTLHTQQGYLGGVAQAHWGLAQVYCVLGDYDGAESSLAKAREIFTEIRDNVGTADTVYGIARLHKRRCQFSKAKELYVEAQAIYARTGNQLGIAETTCGLAEIQRLECKFGRAELAYREAADLYHQVGDTLGVARTKCGLGDIFCQKGIPDKAEELYLEARGTIEQIGHPLELANALYGLGNVCRFQGNYAEAARYFHEAEAIHARIGDQLGAAEVHYGIGELYRLQDEHHSAAAAYSKARDLFHAVDHHIGAADAMCGLAHVHRVQGEDVKAETLLNQAEGIYQEKEYEMGVASAALGLAAVHIERLEHEAASSAITKALDFYTRANIPSLRARALMMLALTHQIQEQIYKAMLCISEAISVYTGIGDESSVLACQELLFQVRDF
ncbi:hypothetical protein FRC00_009131 [Tulasnella sp. 408]|nr:hypothetical protein FRC00_009131 [Tulasnella sp. 408]